MPRHSHNLLFTPWRRHFALLEHSPMNRRGSKNKHFVPVVRSYFCSFPPCGRSALQPAGTKNQTVDGRPHPLRTQELITGPVVNLLEQKQSLYGDFTKNGENKHKPGDVARNGPRKAGTSGNDLDRHREPTPQGRGSKGGCGAALRGAA